MKPSDFLLGVLDFFAILLPGSIATWLATQYIPPPTLRDALSFGLGDGTAKPDSIVLGLSFLFSSYLLGHFIFMAGARLDPSYDRWRKAVKPTNRDVAFLAAEKLQRKLTPELVGGEFSTLKWAKAYVQVKAPEARIEIDRLEADSKFFRSLIVVGAFASAHFLLRERSPVAGIIALVMTGLSYLRFREQRWKMTELSYGTAVIADAAGPPKESSTPLSKPEGETED